MGGSACKAHHEPASKDCFDLNTGKPLQKQADWCSLPWCYVDPCTCNNKDIDIGQSTYFTTKDGTKPWLAFSYDNCKAAAPEQGTADADLSTYQGAYCGAADVAGAGGCSCCWLLLVAAAAAAAGCW